MSKKELLQDLASERRVMLFKKWVDYRKNILNCRRAYVKTFAKLLGLTQKNYEKAQNIVNYTIKHRKDKLQYFIMKPFAYKPRTKKKTGFKKPDVYRNLAWSIEWSNTINKWIEHISRSHPVNHTYAKRQYARLQKLSFDNINVAETMINYSIKNNLRYISYLPKEEYECCMESIRKDRKYEEDTKKTSIKKRILDREQCYYTEIQDISDIMPKHISALIDVDIYLE